MAQRVGRPGSRGYPCVIPSADHRCAPRRLTGDSGTDIRREPRRDAGSHTRHETPVNATKSSGPPADASNVLERILSPAVSAADTGGLHDLRVLSWSEELGTLSDGRIAHRSASCLIRPSVGDRVIAWRAEDGEWWVLGVLSRAASSETPTVLASNGPLAVEATRIALRSPEIHLHADDLLVSARHHHAVSDVQTDSVRLRVFRRRDRRASRAAGERRDRRDLPPAHRRVVLPYAARGAHPRQGGAVRLTDRPAPRPPVPGPPCLRRIRDRSRELLNNGANGYPAATIRIDRRR